MSGLTRLSNQRGITVAEVLIAAAIVGIGLVALMSVVSVASFGIQDGNQTSHATFLAQQRLEEVRNARWAAASDCVGLSASATSAPSPSPAGTCGGTAVTFPDEATVPGFTQYARRVRIQDCGNAANAAVCGGITNAGLRLVTVTVTYRPISATGGASADTSVRLEWLVAQR
jgi:Tfp pilus assembly protein PilV